MWLPLRLDQKTVTYAIISPKMVNPTDIAGNVEAEDLSQLKQITAKSEQWNILE